MGEPIKPYLSAFILLTSSQIYTLPTRVLQKSLYSFPMETCVSITRSNCSLHTSICAPTYI